MAIVIGRLSQTALAVAFLVLSMVLASYSFFKQDEWTDRASLFLLSVGYLGSGIFVVGLGIIELYLFVSLLILSAHLMRLRAVAGSLRHAAALDETMVDRLKTVFLAYVLRGAVVSMLTFMVSLIVFLVASSSPLLLRSDVLAFLLALSVLLALLLISLVQR